MRHIVPNNLKEDECFRKKINLDNYDFSLAKVHLIGSINGKFKGKSIDKYGIKRF